MPSVLTEQEAIATILVNQRFMRNGSPPIINALDLLPKKLKDEVMGDAQAVIDGLKASRLQEGAQAIDDKKDRLWECCESYIKGKQVCEEGVYQMDHIALTALDFISSVGEIIGFYEYPPEDEAAP